MMKPAKRKVALVTGTGRLKGIGYAICAELAKQNFDIFFTYWGPYDRQMPWTVEIDEPKQIQEEIVRLGVGCERMEFDLSADELDRHYEVNLKGTTMLTMEFIRRFKYRKGGRIINLTSGQSLGEMSQEIVYALTKAAVETLTKTISQEIAKKGITINAVNPGPTDTGWMDEELTALILSKSPMGRVGTPRDAARLIAFLASEEAQWITGQIIHSEGGFTR